MLNTKAYRLDLILRATFWIGLPATGIIHHAVRQNSVPTLDSNVKVSMRIFACHDGDTCRGQDGAGLPHTMRLAGIDAPEADQPPLRHARAATERVRNLSESKDCEVQLLGKDAYQRDLALIWCDHIFVNETLAQEGLVYAYVNLRFPDSAYAWAERAERRARVQRLGLFRAGHLSSPHEYRRRKKRRSIEKPQTTKD